VRQKELRNLVQELQDLKHMETIPSSGTSVGQATCYFSYVIAVHRTLLKLGEYLWNTLAHVYLILDIYKICWAHGSVVG
jgi:hypothetical protein